MGGADGRFAATMASTSRPASASSSQSSWISNGMVGTMTWHPVTLSPRASPARLPSLRSVRRWFVSLARTSRAASPSISGAARRECVPEGCPSRDLNRKQVGLPPGRRALIWNKPRVDRKNELLGTPPATAPRARRRRCVFLCSWRPCRGPRRRRDGRLAPPRPRWHVFILSGGGYSSEANALLVGLSSLSDAPAVRATQHGDAVDVDFYRGLPHYRTALDAMMRSRLPALDAVVVCHSEPGAWHPQLFHTARCPPRTPVAAAEPCSRRTDSTPNTSAA